MDYPPTPTELRIPRVPKKAPALFAPSVAPVKQKHWTDLAREERSADGRESQFFDPLTGEPLGSAHYRSPDAEIDVTNDDIRKLANQNLRDLFRGSALNKCAFQVAGPFYNPETRKEALQLRSKERFTQDIDTECAADFLSHVLQRKVTHSIQAGRYYLNNVFLEDLAALSQLEVHTGRAYALQEYGPPGQQQGRY